MTPTQAQIKAAVQAMRVHCLRIARPLQELNELAAAALTAAAGVGVPPMTTPTQAQIEAERAVGFREGVEWAKANLTAAEDS